MVNGKKHPAPDSREAILQADLNWADGLTTQAQASRFYGKLTITFEDGVIKRAEKNQSLKPPHASG